MKIALVSSILLCILFCLSINAISEHVLAEATSRETDAL